MAASEYGIVITTTDRSTNADKITETLLQARLAACIQRSVIQSSYQWKGKIIVSEEIRLEIKSSVNLFEKIKETILQLHTYDVPEIIMLPLLDADDAYLEWMDKETHCQKHIESIDATKINEVSTP